MKEQTQIVMNVKYEDVFETLKTIERVFSGHISTPIVNTKNRGFELQVSSNDNVQRSLK